MTARIAPIAAPIASTTPSIRSDAVLAPNATTPSPAATSAAATALVAQGLTDLGGGPCYNDARVEIARIAADAVTARA